MRIGVPKEIKTKEYRVALTPSGAKELTSKGHEVYVQMSAGLESGYPDEAYASMGAKILPHIKDIYAISDMIVKVKEPLEEEYPLVRKDQIIFTFFHFASSRKLTEAMIKSEAICIAYETVEKANKSLPILIPMSEVAGRMSVQQGAKYLEKPNKGRGVLLGGVPGVRPATVLILGGGIVGTQAAKMAAGLGADVTIMDINTDRLRYLSDIMPANVKTVMSNQYQVEQAVKEADLVIGAVLIPGAKAPVLVKKEMLKTMKQGAVVIDVAVDQGGCIETCTPTTHENPTYIIDDIVHYCVANMPGAVPYTSTQALTNITLPYIAQIASKGWVEACQTCDDLYKGLNIVNGDIVYSGVAEAFGLEYVNPAKYIK
jgi:alanine dehydrogenase